MILLLVKYRRLCIKLNFTNSIALNVNNVAKESDRRSRANSQHGWIVLEKWVQLRLLEIDWQGERKREFQATTLEYNVRRTATVG